MTPDHDRFGWARRVDAVAPDIGDLGAPVVDEYLRAHSCGRALGDDDRAQ